APLAACAAAWGVAFLDPSDPMDCGISLNITCDATGMVDWMVLNSGGIAGPIPPSIGSLIGLTHLDLDNNALTGSIPPTISLLTRLLYLDLSYNQLSGSIPTAIDGLLSITELNFRYNRMTGSIPAVIGNLTTLNDLYLSSNQLKGSLPAEIGNLHQLSTLDVISGNHLSGVVPPVLGGIPLGTLSIYDSNLTCPTGGSCQLKQDPMSAFCLECPDFCTSCTPSPGAALPWCCPRLIPSLSSLRRFPLRQSVSPFLCISVSVTFENCTYYISSVSLPLSLPPTPLTLAGSPPPPARSPFPAPVFPPPRVPRSPPAPPAALPPLVSPPSPPPPSPSSPPPRITLSPPIPTTSPPPEISLPPPALPSQPSPSTNPSLIPPPLPPPLPSSPSVPPTNSSSSSSGGGGVSVAVVAGVAAAAVCVVVVLLVLGFCWWRSKKKKQHVPSGPSHASSQPFLDPHATAGQGEGAMAAAKPSLEATNSSGSDSKHNSSSSSSAPYQPVTPLGSMDAPPLFHQFALRELEAATQCWSPDCKIGSGAFGDVYRGVCPGNAGVVWAVKRARIISADFRREVDQMATKHHPNLVRLLGFCNDVDAASQLPQQILVYEFMGQGDLAKRMRTASIRVLIFFSLLFALSSLAEPPLTLQQRLDILIGAARGLEYLHSFGIVHRDIKPANILLNANMQASPRGDEYAMRSQHAGAIPPPHQPPLEKPISTRLISAAGACYGLPATPPLFPSHNFPTSLFALAPHLPSPHRECMCYRPRCRTLVCSAWERGATPPQPPAVATRAAAVVVVVFWSGDVGGGAGARPGGAAGDRVRQHQGLGEFRVHSKRARPGGAADWGMGDGSGGVLGRGPVMLLGTECVNIKDWAAPLLAADDLTPLLDPSLQAQPPGTLPSMLSQEQQVRLTKALTELGLACTHVPTASRPSMASLISSLSSLKREFFATTEGARDASRGRKEYGNAGAAGGAGAGAGGGAGGGGVVGRVIHEEDEENGALELSGGIGARAGGEGSGAGTGGLAGAAGEACGKQEGDGGGMGGDVGLQESAKEVDRAFMEGLKEQGRTLNEELSILNHMLVMSAVQHSGMHLSSSSALPSQEHSARGGDI
ncbi:unnamed protein product, partial [Closterium sp. NIES-54]